MLFDHSLTHDSCTDNIYKRGLASLFAIATGMAAGIQMHTVLELTLPSPAPGPEAEADTELDGITGWWSTVSHTQSVETNDVTDSKLSEC